MKVMKESKDKKDLRQVRGGEGKTERGSERLSEGQRNRKKNKIQREKKNSVVISYVCISKKKNERE